MSTTFTISKRRPKVLGRHVHLTLEQYAAARKVFYLHLSNDELLELMELLHEEESKPRPPRKPKVKGEAKPADPHWWPKPIAPSIKVEKAEPPVNPIKPRQITDSMTWQEIAEMGVGHKLDAIKRLRRDDPAYYGLKEAKDHVEQYMNDRGIK